MMENLGAAGLDPGALEARAAEAEAFLREYALAVERI